MIFLPIVGRELRAASRRRGTYWVRFISAGALVALGTLFFALLSREMGKELGLVLFGLMTGGATLFALLSGVRSTADCLSEEKREGTLGLLFLTDLKGYDVVFGKLAANSLNAFYSVVSAVPILAVPLLLGGVAGAEFERMALVAINTLFFSLAIGMGISAVSRQARKAMTATLFLLLFFAAGCPLIAYLLDSQRVFLPLLPLTRALTPFFNLPSPGFSFAYAFDAMYKTQPDAFWDSMAVIHGVGWVFLLLACFAARRTWQDRPSGERSRRWRDRWQAWSYGTSAERKAFRTRLLNQNAIFWLIARPRLQPAVRVAGPRLDRRHLDMGDSGIHTFSFRRFHVRRNRTGAERADEVLVCF